jgi:hypothetical protein
MLETAFGCLDCQWSPRPGPPEASIINAIVVPAVDQVYNQGDLGFLITLKISLSKRRCEISDSCEWSSFRCMPGSISHLLCHLGRFESMS